MKIRSEVPVKKFRDVETGKAFYVDRNDQYYMKLICGSYDKRYKHMFSDDLVNAAGLSDGKKIVFSDDFEVIELDAELVV